MDACEDGKLYVSMNLSFACSLREGEILGLTWDNVHISDEDIRRDDAHVYIDKELQRCSKRSLEKLEEKAGLPNVVFHSLRHSSTTYKLKLNHGDLKATQGDTGHSQIDMITDIYAHILDEDRKVNAIKFENAFYSINTDLRGVQAPNEESQTTVDISTLIEQLQKSPELLQTLSQMLSANAS